MKKKAAKKQHLTLQKNPYDAILKLALPSDKAVVPAWMQEYSDGYEIIDSLYNSILNTIVDLPEGFEADIDNTLHQNREIACKVLGQIMPGCDAYILMQNDFTKGILLGMLYMATQGELAYIRAVNAGDDSDAEIIE